MSASPLSDTVVGAVAGLVHRSTGGRHRLTSTTGRTLWTRPPRAVAYVLAVDTLAVAVSVIELFRAPAERSTLVFFALLMFCSVAYIEASRPIEKIRENYASTPHIDLNSVWMFAAVLLLHPTLTATVITTSYTYRWLRVRRHVLHRQVFSAAATILAAYAAAICVSRMLPSGFDDAPRTPSTFAAVAVAGAVFMVVNTALISLAVATSMENPRVRTVLGEPGDYALEAATIALGVLLAWALVGWPVAMLLIVGVTLVLHRNVLIHQLRDKARKDAKTGLLNAAAWASTVDSELTRAARSDQPSGLLLIDLDHFKEINDEFGHLAGDQMLRAVANTITSEVRSYDLVGRFGGEEFVVLLPETSGPETRQVAERIRRRIAELAVPIAANGAIAMFDRLTVSIGIAAFPEHGETCSDVMQAADMAMYAAKAAGRNQVRHAPQGC